MIKIAVSKYSVSRKLPPGDAAWPRFNSSFENTELDTRGIMSMVYAGRPITTQHKNNWRTSENYICGQHLGLDFDTEDESSTIEKLKTDKFISCYAAFIHSTISHKPEAPRSRVIFTLDAPIMQAKNYSLAASALLWIFGGADRQCKDAVRFFYGAPGCKIELIDKVLPLSVVKKLIADYQESGQLEKHHAARHDYLVPPSQQEVSDALNLIPAWGIDYDEWVMILMGIHSAFGIAGLGLAEAWAAGKPGEVAQKFRSFREDGNPAGAVTIATVFGIAKKYGWKKV